jgi:hypothetical protein
MLLAIGAGSFLITGCDSPTDGDRGANGAPGTIYLAGTYTSEAIQNAIDTWAPLVFAGVTQSDGDAVIIPAGRNVELIGSPAYSANANGTLAIEARSSITGNGQLRGGGTTTIAVVPEGVNVTNATVVNIQEGAGDIDLDGSNVAVRGPITISGEDTDSSNINDSELATKALYVVGNVTVSTAITTAPTIKVIGNASITAVQTQAVVWEITGDLDARKKPTTGAGTLYVGGNAVFAEEVAGITGGINIDGSATFSAALTTGAGGLDVGGNLIVTGAASLGGDLEVGGTATFSSTLGNAVGETVTAEFDGPTIITGVLTTAATGTLTIAGEGAVSLAAAPTLTNGLIVTNTAGVTMPSTGAIPASKSINASAGKVVFGTAANSVTIEKGSLISAAVGLATVAADGVITLPFSTNAASLVLADGGSIAIAGTGKVAIGTVAELKGAGSKWTAGTDTVTFAPTAAAAGKIEGGTSATLTPSGDAAELNLLAATAQALTIGGTTKFTLDLSSAGKITFGNTAAGSTITLTANTDGIKLTNSLAIVGTATAGGAFAGAFVDGGGTYNATDLNVSLVDGVITHSTTNAARPEKIDKTTTAAVLADSDS